MYFIFLHRTAIRASFCQIDTVFIQSSLLGVRKDVSRDALASFFLIYETSKQQKILGKCPLCVV